MALGQRLLKLEKYPAYTILLTMRSVINQKYMTLSQLRMALKRLGASYESIDDALTPVGKFYRKFWKSGPVLKSDGSEVIESGFDS
jgi:hypothetical protein